MKEHSLTDGNILHVLLSFSVPFLIANLLQSLYGAVDLFVIGQFCNAQSVAAVSTGTQVTQIITSLVTGLTLGSTILIGEYTGRREPDQVRRTIGTTLTVFAGVAVFLTVVMLLLERQILTLLHTPAESFDLTMQYVAICLIGNFFICGYNAISAILRGCGDSVRPMFFVGISCVLNIILDFIFVRFFRLGVSGTAFATVLSQAASMFIAVAFLKRSHFIFDFRLSSFRPDKHLIKRLAVIGIPISFQEMMVRISFLYLTATMNSCGVYAAAIVGISSKYDVFAMLTATSMANALAAVTAQNMGAGKPQRARKSLWYGLGFALFISSLFWLWAQFSPQTMIGVFSDDSNVIAAGIPFFHACSYDYILVSVVFCLNGYLNGLQKTVWTMISCSAAALLFRIPLVWIAGTYFADNLGILGTVAPTVSGIMACYTFAYVLWSGRHQAHC